MNNKCSKYASLVLVPLTAINVFVGCTMETKRDVMDVPYDDALSMQDIVSSEVVQDTNEFSELIDIYGKSGLDYSEILLIEDRWCDLYSSGLYAKLKAFLLDDEVILNELENIICFGTQATCMSEEMWISSFGNLLNTISEYDNVVDYYYPLAAYVHKRNCDLKHEPLFFDDKRITCSNIEELLNRKVPVFDYKNYVVDMIKNSGHADLPLHTGTVPRWLADRMMVLGTLIVESLVENFGVDEVLVRLSDPLWFQSLGAVMGMDWHSSGITTSVMYAVKRGLNARAKELGIYV
jgi:hypothetical protein